MCKRYATCCMCDDCKRRDKRTACNACQGRGCQSMPQKPAGCRVFTIEGEMRPPKAPKAAPQPWDVKKAA